MNIFFSNYNYHGIYNKYYCRAKKIDEIYNNIIVKLKDIYEICNKYYCKVNFYVLRFGFIFNT
jgi:hypothetical protein